MLFGGQTIADLGGRYSERGIHTAGMKLVVCEAEGITLDEALFRRRHPIRSRKWSAAWVVLSGNAVMHVGDRTEIVGPGTLVTTHDNTIPRFRVDAREETWRALTFTWETPHDENVETAFDHANLRPREVERLSSLVTSRAPNATVLSGAREILRAHGLPLERLSARDLIALYEPEPEEAALFTTLSAVLNRLEAQPMLVDFERALGLSARTTNRKLRAMRARFQVGSWRRFLGSWRVMAASALLSRPTATTEYVAKRVGLGSPVALCHAFSRVGLPSPQRLRESALAF